MVRRNSAADSLWVDRRSGVRSALQPNAQANVETAKALAKRNHLYLQGKVGAVCRQVAGVPAEPRERNDNCPDKESIVIAPVRAVSPFRYV